MADVSWDQVKDYLSNLTIKDLSDKVKELEEEWGVKAASGGGMMVAAAVDGPAAAEEQTEFDAILTAAGQKKIQVIKAVRELTGLGLKEAKALVDSAPAAIKEGISQDDAEAVKAKIEEAGGSVEVK